MSLIVKICGLSTRETLDAFAEAIDSILGQTVGELELIVVDDGSTDATAEIVRESQAADSRVRYLPLAHMGISRSLNEGLRAARAEFVAFQDADERDNTPMGPVDTADLASGSYPVDAGPGTVGGPYRLVEQVDEGGVLVDHAHDPAGVAVAWARLCRRRLRLQPGHLSPIGGRSPPNPASLEAHSGGGRPPPAARQRSAQHLPRPQAGRQDRLADPARPPLDEREIAIPIFGDMGENGDPDALVGLGELTSRYGDARGMLLLGKAALNRGMPFDFYAYPVTGIPPYSPIGPDVEKSVVFAIARQESQFNPGDVSPAQAYGLMQVTPDAGRYVCKRRVNHREISNTLSELAALLCKSYTGIQARLRYAVSTEGNLKVTVLHG